MMKRIVLCADDYGQAPAISKAILALIQNHRVYAASCMVNSRYWEEHAAWLAPFQTQADIGLHVNVSEGRALSDDYIKRYGKEFFPLKVLLRKSLLRQIDQAAIEAEAHAQLDRFIAAMGFLPRYMDGHQHAHQFPVIRNAFINVYRQRLSQHGAYVRLVNTGLGGLKQFIIHATGTKGLKKLLEDDRIPHNQSFAGIYPFAKSAAYPQHFKRFLREVSDGGMIMCHPGLLPIDGNDVIGVARYAEYQYLTGVEFLKDCATRRIKLARMSEMI